jgi:hypothetical protein
LTAKTSRHAYAERIRNMANIISTKDGYHTTGNADKPNRWVIVSESLYDAMESGSAHPMMKPDETWNAVNLQAGCIKLSPDNSKVTRHAKRRGTKAVSYGKSTVVSCPFAGSCIRFCYQNLNGYTASMRMHGHNYKAVYSLKVDELIKVFSQAVKSLPKSVTIVRLNDNGDFVSKDEILAWAQVASENADLVFYGYTKNTPHLFQARQTFGKFPANFRVSISDLNENDATSEKYQHIIRETYPNEFRVCRIIDTPERDELYANLPWNDEEMQAYDYTSDFKIALHIGSSQIELCTPDELVIVEKYKSGYDGDVKVC